MLQEQEPSSEEKGTRSGIILIVEDDETNGELLAYVISHELHYLPMLVTTSTRALEVIQHLKPDLFVLDYYLADMNGLKLYDHLHNIPGLETLPAIILSASLEPHQREIEQRQLVGLEKPFDLDNLLETIRKAIN